MKPRGRSVVESRVTGEKDSRIPVVLFIYKRFSYLKQILDGLRWENIPLLYVYADGPRGNDSLHELRHARAQIRLIDWCEVRIIERNQNLGLGKSILKGVTEVARVHDQFIVWEDDLICVPGTYAWMCAALCHYSGFDKVMSVTAWTHPRITPPNLNGKPFFDGRAECWVWGAWSKSWRGMLEETALQKMTNATLRGVRPDAFGSDLPEMAKLEEKRNIWAVRWLYHHIQHGGFCLRPPWSMIEHKGYDEHASNCGPDRQWDNPSLRQAPSVPCEWPAPQMHPGCRELWREAVPSKWRRRWRLLGSRLRLRMMTNQYP